MKPKAGRKIQYALSILGKSLVYKAGGKTDMQFLLLIYDAEADWVKMSPADQAKMYEDYGRFTNEIKQNGNHLAGHQLQPIATATTVRVRNGKRLTTDGPFAETKEQLGGFYMIEAKDQAEAIAIAERIPSAKVGSIEVRPIVVHQAAAGK
jgi:hypothetical protein